MAQLKIDRSVDGEAVSPELRPLLEAVYNEIARRPANLNGLWESLDRLLVYLASPMGRTNSNCWAANNFFLLCEGWETDWDHLPNSFGDILGDMAKALHDTVEAPEIARNFESTPEQLLERLRAIKIKSDEYA